MHKHENTSTVTTLSGIIKIIRASAVLTWILKESGWRTILSHRDALMILMHDISQWDCACEKHVLAQIRCCAS